MNSDPTLFHSTMLETANEAFLFARSQLENDGFEDEVQQLGGFDPIYCRPLAAAAAKALLAVRPKLSGKSRDLADIAVGTLQRALEQAVRLNAA